MIVKEIKELAIGCELLLVKKEGEEVNIRYTTFDESSEFDNKKVKRIDSLDFKLISIELE